MSHSHGTLEVTIVEGRQLKDEDMVGKNDAYVELYVDKDYKQRTTTVQNSNNPTWNEKFIFQLRKHDDDVHFHVYDDDVVGRDSVGSAKIDLKKHVFGKGRYDQWIKLPAMLGLRSKGELHVIIEHHSKSYQRDLKQDNDKQTISLDLWANGCQWVKSNKSILSTEPNNSVQFFVPAGDERKTTNPEIDVMQETKWYSFDPYKIKAFNIWCVTLPMDKLKWNEGLYNYPAFFKKFMCEHVIDMVIILSYCKPPPAAKDIKIGEKRRRGRPSKAKKALLVQ